ncbi:MAG: ABC-2 type transport system ATP-binding protein [Chlamydiales bacterium]|jgi:ABC-2 type transport system ATP-binding protein
MDHRAQQKATGAPIICDGLTRRFGSTVALHPLSLAVGSAERGSVIGLLGPNGSGKSTFMRLLVGLVRPDAGSASVDGVQLRGDGTAVRRRATYAPGELHMYGEMRAGEHLSWLLRGRDRAALPRARELAEGFGLPLDQRVRGYSHGMKRQLIFAAAIAPKVRVRILDEPTEGLDPSIRSTILDHLEEDARNGTTVLLSSHHLPEVQRSCERLLFMNAGKLLADTTADEVAGRSARVLRIGWSPEVDVDLMATRLRDAGVDVRPSDGNGVSILLETPDPRPFLGQLAEQRDWPAPNRVEHGSLSMTELYRELYGVEGC